MVGFLLMLIGGVEMLCTENSQDHSQNKEIELITFNLRYSGQYYDLGTKQFYNHNRFYKPEGRRWGANRKGTEPIDKDGNSINFHHMLQTDKGGLRKVTKTFHQ